MSDKRISQLVERLDIENNDVLPIVALGASTTNKVTIATIEDYMQANLDMGVTSVGLTKTGDALAITGSPITAAGTINIAFAGTSGQYVNGAGNLTTFPSLTGFVPYTGATTNVNLGEFGLTAGYYGFDLTPTGTPTGLGTMYWDSFYRTISLIDGDGDTTLQIGQEQRTLVHNNTGATLTDGQVVYVTGSTGELPSVALASNTSEATSSVTFGVVTESIANGADGFITTSGIVHGLNTLAFNEGDTLWLGSTAGTFTNVKPIAPANSVLVGYMIKKAGGNGSIFVKIQNGYELDELHDVLITSVANNEGIFWDSATSLWKNKSIATALGYTPANAARNLTINGTTYNLTADRTWNVGTVTSVGLSAPTGFSVTGSPVTGSGTLGLSFAAGYSLPTNIKQGNWDDAYTFVTNFPTQTGNAGKFLSTNGSALSWETVIAGVQSVTASSPLFSSGGANPNITIQVANTSQNGYLSSTDWNTFNSKASTADLANYLPLTGGTLTGPLNGTSANFSSNVESLGAVITKIGASNTIGAGSNINWNNAGALTASRQIALQLNALNGLSLWYYNGAVGSWTNTGLSFNNDGSIVSPSIQATTFTDGLITWGNAQINRTGGIVELQYASGGDIRFFGQGATPITFYTNGGGTFSGNLYVNGGTNTNIGNGFHAFYSGGYAEVQLNGTNGSLIDFSTSGTDYKGRILYDNTSNSFQFITNGANQVQITSGGNLLVGTTTDAGFKLDVNGTGRFTGSLSGTSATFSSTIGTGGDITITKASAASFIANNTSASGKSFRLLSADDGTFRIQNTGIADLLTIASTGAATFSSSVTATSFSINSNGTLSSNAFWGTLTTKGAGSYADWSLISSGGSGIMFNPTGTLNMSFSGNVLIGTTTDGGQKLQVNGTTKIIASSLGLTIDGGSGALDRGVITTHVDRLDQLALTRAGVGTFAVKITTGNVAILSGYDSNVNILSMSLASGVSTFISQVYAQGFYESSDMRLKTLIEDNYLVKTISDVKAKLYKKNGVTEVGYYAQDLQEILPSAVTEGNDGFLSLSYSQVHTAKIAALEDKIAQLEELIKTLIK